jgi:hypothetical protein
MYSILYAKPGYKLLGKIMLAIMLKRNVKGVWERAAECQMWNVYNT